MDPRQARLDRVAADVDRQGTVPGLAAGRSAAVALPSHSNDCWLIGPLVLRICWLGDVDRLRREAALAGALPAGVRYPPLIASGRVADLTWTVTRRVAGTPLAEAWPRLPAGDRRRAIGGLAEALAALHAWRPPHRLARDLAGPAPVDLADRAAVIGATILPLPVARTFALAEHARALPGIDERVLDAALDRVTALARHDPYAADAGEAVVVHGDAHLANLLWSDDGQDISALLDLEWARLGAPDQDLEPLLRCVDWSGHDPDAVPVPDAARLLGWLAADHPALFAAPNLLERLWLYQLAATIRDVHTWPATEPADRLGPEHPRNLLARFARSADHLERVLPG